MRIIDWSSDVCSSDLVDLVEHRVDMRLPRRVRFLPGLVEGGPAFQRLAGRLQLRVALVEVVDRAEVRLRVGRGLRVDRSEEHTSELQSLMRISYAVFCLKKKNKNTITNNKY